MKKTICTAALVLALAALAALIKTPGDRGAAVWSQAEYKVIIDAGHGGIDGGAVGYSGAVEKDLTLAIAKKCELMLVFFGVDVVMTRNEDKSLDDGSGSTIARRKADDIKARVAIANSGADALVSIHMNSFPDSRYSGTQTFYSKNNEKSVRLAKNLQSTARGFLNPDNRREIKAAPDSIYLMKHTEIPAVIVECGFISNAREEELLKTDAYQIKVAMAVTAGTLAFLGNSA